MAEGEGDVDNEALGRGNRRRKKRKFFDEDGGAEQGGGARKKRGSLEDEVIKRFLILPILMNLYIWPDTFHEKNR